MHDNDARPAPEDPETRHRRAMRAAMAMFAVLIGTLIVGIPVAIFLYRWALGLL